MIEYIKNLHKSLYFQILNFVFWVKIKDTPHVTALLNLSFLMFMNVVTIYIALKIIFFRELHIENVFTLLLVFFLILLVNYSSLIKDISFVEKFEELRRANTNSKKVASLVYILLTISLFIIFMIKGHDTNMHSR